MHCEKVAEQLPWYLNQTLEPSERQAVDSHLATCDSCRQELDETRAAARIYAQHIPHDVLVDFAFARSHSRISEDRVRQHLESCPTCLDDLSLIRRSEARMYQEEGWSATGAAAHASQRACRQTSATTWRWAAAAAILVGVLGLGWGRTWLTLQKVNAEQSLDIQVGDQMIEITSDQDRAEDVLRGDADVDAVRRSSHCAVLVLYSKTFDEVQPKVEVVDGNNRVIYACGELPLTRRRDYLLILPTDRLDPGPHQVRLYGTDSGAEVLATFSFFVEP